ncbi:hypothetical protein MC885_004263 [Smutsia gigantea]|nr:hypothetical protein MC885_004263 [Smutsia gigantea]
MDQFCEAIKDPGNDTTRVALRAAFTGQVLFHSITVVMTLCGLVGNGIVIWLVRLSIRKNSFSVYSLNLAIVDLMHLCFQIVYSLRQILKFLLNYCFCLPGIVMVLRFFFGFTGLGIMAAVSFQRCLSAQFPIWYRCHCPKHPSAVMSALLWILTFLMNILRGHACGQLLIDVTKSCSTLATVPSAWAFFLFPLMGSSSLLLLRRVQQSLHKQKPRKLYLVVLLTVLVSFLCGLPLSIIRFLGPKMDNQTLNDICILSSINSAPNPATYFFIGGIRRQHPSEPLKLILQRALGEATEDEEDGKEPRLAEQGGTTPASWEVPRWVCVTRARPYCLLAASTSHFQGDGPPLGQAPPDEHPAHLLCV